MRWNLESAPRALSVVSGGRESGWEMIDNSSEIDVQDLALLVAGLSRFLHRLAGMPSFQGDLALAEWCALSQIAAKDKIPPKQLANILGVTIQRAIEISDALQAADLIVNEASPENPKKRVLSITSAGSKRLKDMNDGLRPMIVAGLDTRPQALNRASRVINGAIMRIVAPPKPAAS
jgi:DNA-binding MarR family transcriptional regulator